MRIEKKLGKKAKKLIKQAKRKKIRKVETEDIFDARIHLEPERFDFINYKRKPISVFNPGALLHKEYIYLFPRVVYEFHKYVSSIGVCRIEINKVLDNKIPKKIEGFLLIRPQKWESLQVRSFNTYETDWELIGCEDARVHEHKDKILMLYTGVEHPRKEIRKKLFRKYEVERKRSVLALAELEKNFVLEDIWKYGKIEEKMKRGVRKLGYFVIKDGKEEYCPLSNKDSTFLKISGENASMLTRPEISFKIKELEKRGIDGVRIGWRCKARLNELSLYELEPVLPMYPEYEDKVGWSTNAWRLSSNEYLVGWHAVLRKDKSYRNGLAIVDEEGDLTGISEKYLLVPKGIEEEYGDRPLVIFGDGLLAYKEKLIWVGGISDYGIGIFMTDLDKALEKIRSVL